MKEGWDAFKNGNKQTNKGCEGPNASVGLNNLVKYVCWNTYRQINKKMHLITIQKLSVENYNVKYRNRKSSPYALHKVISVYNSLIIYIWGVKGITALFILHQIKYQWSIISNQQYLKILRNTKENKSWGGRSWYTLSHIHEEYVLQWRLS